jgi:hypothetical protein
MTKGQSKAKEAFQAVLAQEPKEANEIRARAKATYLAKRGRKAEFDNPELKEEILERMANGESLQNICEETYMPSRGRVYQWTVESPSFAIAFARAQESQSHCLLDDCINIADEIDFKEKDSAILAAKINHAKTRIDARLRVIAKMSPNRYGDKVQHVGANGGPIQVAAITIDSAVLDASQRDVLRQALIAARDGHNVIEHDSDKTANES